jgi:hypothetical protein
VGNIPVPPWYAQIKGDYTTQKNPVYLLNGRASVNEQFLQTRLDVRHVYSNAETRLLITALVE